MERITTANDQSRNIDTRVATSIPGIFLELSTSHTPGAYRVSVRRVKIENGICEYKFNRQTLLEDPAPIRGGQIAAARYSKKKLAEIHAEQFADLTDEEIAAAVAWAERY